jgi:type 1 glutamine amidotransferase
MRRHIETCLKMIGPLVLLLLTSQWTLADNRAAFFQPDTLRVLVFSGRNNHEWRITTPFLKQVLLESKRFDVRVEEEPQGVTPSTLAVYDVLVLDYNGPRWGEETEKAVEDFVRSGKGLVVVHGASYAFTGLETLGDNHKRMGLHEPAWPWYEKMVGLYWSEDPPKTGHGKRYSFAVKTVNSQHPIMAGMKESFIATDELYHNFKKGAEINVLATAFDDPKFGGTGKNEPILWTVNYGKGRVFHTALGHHLAAMQEDGFINTFVRGTEWAASGQVTLPPEVTKMKTTPTPLRLLIVTGGHDYPTSFYTVFEGWDDIQWTHALSNHEAFRNPIKDQYDVLVLYDLSQEITEAERKSLTDFLDSGKGMIVLHHAIADYQSWLWWSQEVVGGKYLLKPEGDKPASSYKHDEELFVQPTMDHPITASVGPLHLWDETYRELWISPQVQVLLKTDNPTSDGPVAWICPYQKSRAVYIELGHDQMAHRNAGYRTLVHNAILWTARRLDAKK